MCVSEAQSGTPLACGKHMGVFAEKQGGDANESKGTLPGRRNAHWSTGSEVVQERLDADAAQY